MSAHGGANYGDVIETSGGNLPCKAILHGACVGIKDDNCEKVSIFC